MSVIVLFIFFTTINAESEWGHQTAKPIQNPCYNRNLQSFQRPCDVDSIIIQANQQPEECNLGDMEPSDNDCTAYYECVNGYYKLRSCPSNTFFDPALKYCHGDYVCQNRAYELPTTSSSCKYGELRVDETSCRNYYSCVGNNRHFERRFCPNGEIFDRLLHRCISDIAGNKCQQQTAQQNFEQRNIAVGLACSENSGPSGYNADPTDCRRYYQCAQGRWIRMQCPSNLIWNPAATVCDWPENTLLSCQ
ncbi:Chondroitin proteoglycan [Dirofilaria immitis]